MPIEPAGPVLAGEPMILRRPHRIIPLVAFLLAVLFPATGGASVESSEQSYASGRELVRSEKFDEAARHFEKAVAEYPGHVEARFQLGLIYARSVSTYEKAEREFTSIPEIAMRSGGRSRDDAIFRAGLALGKLYIKSGRNEQAIRIIRGVVASAPPDARLDDAFNALGLAYYYERLYEDAMFELRRAIKLNPANLDARFNLKTIRTRLEHFNAAKVYSRLGQRREAVAEFRKAIELDPRFVEARHRLGAELFLLGSHDEALKELRRSELISRNYRKVHEIWFAQGLTLAALGRDGEALETLLRTVRLRPGFAAAHNEIGKIHLKRGDRDAAINCFVKAIGIEPRTDYVRNLQAAMLRKGQ